MPAAPRPAAGIPAQTPAAAPRPPVAPPPPAVEEVPLEEAPVEEVLAQEFVAAEPPHAETPVDHDAEIAAEADAVAHVVEDDDTLNVPAPSEDVLLHRTPRAPRAPRKLLSRSLFFKQTMIPILLTVGVILAGLGGWLMSMGEDSPLVNAVWIPIALLAFGGLMLIFAVVTMLQVKNQLDADKAAAA